MSPLLTLGPVNYAFITYAETNNLITKCLLTSRITSPSLSLSCETSNPKQPHLRRFHALQCFFPELVGSFGYFLRGGKWFLSSLCSHLLALSHLSGTYIGELSFDHDSPSVWQLPVVPPPGCRVGGRHPAAIGWLFTSSRQCGAAARRSGVYRASGVVAQRR